MNDPCLLTLAHYFMQVLVIGTSMLLGDSHALTHLHSDTLPLASECCSNRMLCQSAKFTVSGKFLTMAATCDLDYDRWSWFWLYLKKEGWRNEGRKGLDRESRWAALYFGPILLSEIQFCSNGWWCKLQQHCLPTLTFCQHVTGPRHWAFVWITSSEKECCTHLSLWISHIGAVCLCGLSVYTAPHLT